MIKKVTLSAVACYKDPVVISGFEKFNLFYGLNGAGKTVLSQYLATYQNMSGRFSQCKIEFLDNTMPEILVYNEDFIHENFWSSDNLKGIFTLDKDNAEAEQAIMSARAELKRFDDLNKLQNHKIETLGIADTNEKNSLKANVWQAKIDYENTAFKDCMTGLMGSKDGFLKRLLESEPVDLENDQLVEQQLNALQVELSQLTSANIQKKQPNLLLMISLETEEINPFFFEKIVGAQDSYLASLIDKLDHADWINQGIIQYLDRTDDCPFCLQGMDVALKSKIKAHIDTIYQDKLNALKQLKSTYEQNKSAIEIGLTSFKEDAALLENNELQTLITQLEILLNSNNNLINNKIKEPSQSVRLSQTLESINKINGIINTENNKIEAFNKKIDNKNQTIREITAQFWKLLCRKFESQIVIYQTHHNNYLRQIEECNNAIGDINIQIETQKKIIDENQKKTKNIDIAINRINSKLKMFGIEGFTIEKMKSGEQNEHFYKIARGTSTLENNTFRTLSEGEKTLITFLYFIEKCIGDDRADHVAYHSNRIIVIDDPISSLSFNLVFDIAILIRDLFLKKNSEYRQVFILTHHLYFLHELFGDTYDSLPKNFSLFRISKAGKSYITSADRKDFKNNYECHWQIIKDVQKNHISRAILPNAMRNILEHYFSFIRGKEKLKKAIDDISKIEDNSSFRAFHRYIDRFSHSDATNLTDTNDIEVERFLNYFKQIFDSTGYGEHYLNMMDGAKNNE